MVRRVWPLTVWTPLYARHKVAQDVARASGNSGALFLSLEHPSLTGLIEIIDNGAEMCHGAASLVGIRMVASKNWYDNLDK